MPNKKLSIIIVNYKSGNFLEKCLASIYEKIKQNISFEIIAVNNDPEEEISFLLKKYPAVKIIGQKNNIGFGAGNNRGFKKSEGEILLFLNPDAEIISDNIQEVLAQFSLDERMGVLGSCLIDPLGRIQKWSAGLEINLYNLILNNLGFLKSEKFWQSREVSSVQWVSGTAMFVRREVFKELDGFDRDFFMYFEDMDFCKRTRNLGKKIIYFPSFKVRHSGGESYSCKKTQKSDYYASLEKYFKKHCPKISFGIVKILRKIWQ